jgi:hypothetical protein
METLAERPTRTLPRQTVRPGATAFQEETVCPLSFAQERMWLLDQIAPGSATCNLFHTVDISGPLAPALLARSLDEVVRRHQTLRTTFAAPGGAPEPVVAPAARRPLPLVDLAGLPEPSWGPEVARLSTEQRRRWSTRVAPLLHRSGNLVSNAACYQWRYGLRWGPLCESAHRYG